MNRVSMPDFRDALSSFKQRLSDYYSQKRYEFLDWAEPKKKKYVLKKEYGKKKRYVVDNVSVYVKYGLTDFLPYVVAYGLMINFPASVLLGWALTWKTVVSWGLVFYLVETEFTDIVNKVIPYVKVTAKVDN